MSHGPDGKGAIDALISLVIGDTESAIDRFAALDQSQAFGWACGYSKALSEWIPEPPPGGHVVVDVERIDGTSIDPELFDLAELGGPFIAASCNDDISGALLLWRAQTIATRARLLFFIAQLAALTIEHAAGRA